MGQVVVENAHPRLKIPPRETSTIAKSVLKNEVLEFDWLNVVFIGDSRSRALNREYLAHDYPTDVLAFRLDESNGLQGEVYVNLDRARVQANDHDVPFMNEVARLVIHGILHLVGYEDKMTRSRRKMKKKEDEYLDKYWSKKTHA